jgi:hypothetical protein
MKKANWLGYMMFVGQLMAAPTDGQQRISLLDLDESVMQDFYLGKMGETIVECPEGARLPLKLIVKGQFLSLEPAAPLCLTVLRTCYIRWMGGGENILFSSDLQTWKGAGEFFTGELRASIEKESGAPLAALHFELNQREPNR